MAGRRLDGGAIRIRRATRHDLPGLYALLRAEGALRSGRFDRRALRDLAGVVSAVEDEAGGLVAALSLTFSRSFAAGHWRAELDGVWLAPGHEELLDGIVTAALRHAARRHCQELIVCGPPSPALAAALERRGAVRADAWRLGIVAPPAAPTGRGRRRRS